MNVNIDKLTDLQRDYIEYLDGKAGCELATIADHFGVDNVKASSVLRGLAANGLVEKIYRGVYRLKTTT